jgi:hypothetical protein
MRVAFYILICLMGFPSIGMIAQGNNKPFSPTAMAVNKKGNVLAIAGKTSNVISLIRLKNGKSIRNIETEFPPTGIVFNADKLWATCSSSQGYLLRVDEKGQNTAKIKVVPGSK